ncbi:acyl-CoA dehydrogenase family protein [Actinokineospora soli]|uniref:Acyl-CoA dehydrogenase family protein n=1 Tax=Actinokineospora soli TaxID=1048753 RepID=A0ABW2TPQ5_9PSEU
MTITEHRVARTHPRPARPGDDAFVDLAARIGAVAESHAREHDREATFVSEAYAAMRAEGYLALAVPADCGGLGASIRQVCYAQAELARHDAAAGLAVAMHQYLVLAQGYRRRKGAPDAETVLRKVAGEGVVIATSGGSDWLWPTTVAVPDGEGYRVSGRKAFCSQAPVATVIATSAVLGETEVLHFSVPLSAPGVRVEQTWDTLGMRGTVSNDVVFEDVFVPAASIAGRRAFGEFGAPLFTAAVHFAPVVAATYFGIAAAARDLAVGAASAGTRGSAPLSALGRVQRQVGLMDSHLRTAWWSLLGALDDLGEDYTASADVLSTVMLAKRHVITAASEVVDLAMDVTGGRAFFARSPLERAYRDVRASRFHPLPPETTLHYAGKLALGDPGDTE